MCLAGIAAIGPVFSAIGGIVSAVATASAAQAQADAEAAAASYNAAIERRNAQAEAYRGAFEAELIRERGDRRLAQQRAAWGVSGALVSEGTPLTVFGQSVADVRLDAASAAWDARVKNQAHLNAASLYDLQAENARKKGQAAAASAIIGGVSGIARGIAGGIGGAGSPVSSFG
jgi:hypothetical protein